MKRKFFGLFVSALLCLCLISCNDPNSGDTPGGTVDPGKNPGDEKEDLVFVDDYVYEGTPTVAPYIVYNEDGTEYSKHTTMFNAIRDAGNNATSKNKMYVEDGNGLQIFKRQSKTQYWCYDGTNFVGTKPRTEALAWGQNRIKCYIIDGQGTGYVMVGTNYYEGSNLNQTINLELSSGAYNYMFTNSGRIEADVWVEKGYGYMETYCRLSEASYKPSKDGNAWNAYIFINGAGGYTCDLGLIGVVRNNQVVWALVRNCSHDDHKNNNATYGDSFTVLSWDPVTTMQYDKELDCYTGADDLFFQCYQGIDGWTLNITNLRTNKVYTIEEKHEDMFKGKEGYLRFLLAASYCPVVSNVWNAECGAALRNVVWDNIYVARWNEEETYTKDMLLEFYPNTPTLSHGFSQGAHCSSSVYSTHKNDGKYKSGQEYKKDDKYLSFSCYYDGGSHYE